MTTLQTQTPHQLSPLQAELLKLYAFGVTDEQLRDIKRLLARYFAERAMNAMDAFWDEHSLTDEIMDKWLQEERGTATDATTNRDAKGLIK